MRPSPTDLFGEIPVTLDEVLAWMLAVPGIPPDSPRFGRYVCTYDVPGKIAREKLAGTLEEALAYGSNSATPWRLAAARMPASSVAIGRPSAAARSK